MPISLVDILSPSRLTEVVDIGANPIDGAPPYINMLKEKVCRVTGFEPQAEALDELLKKKGPNEQYLPYAIGNGETQTLNICKAPGMTSLLEPDTNTLEIFGLFSQFGEVVSQSSVETKTLDEVTEIERVDFLKIDIQGSELIAFEGGRSKLSEAVAVQTEVSFVNLYKNQPGIGDIDSYMRGIGFIPHAFAELKKWPIAPCVINNNPRQGLNQLLEGDMIYVRDFTKPDLMSDEQLKHLALIAHYCYNSFDLALRCIFLLEERKVFKTGTQQKYMKMLSS